MQYRCTGHTKYDGAFIVHIQPELNTKYERQELDHLLAIKVASVSCAVHGPSRSQLHL